MNNLHLYFQPQIESIIDELISAGHTAESMNATLANPDWHRELPFRDVKLHFLGTHNLTLSDWMILVNLITDDYRTFPETLLLQLSTTIEARWEIHMKHEQEDYTANFKPQLQEVVGL